MSEQIEEDAAEPASHTVSVSDPDEGDELDVEVTGEGKYGTFVVDEQFGWTYTLNDDAQKLADGAEVEDTFTLTVSDGNGGTAQTTATITVTGANDAPEVGVDAGELRGNDEPATGKLTFSDIDETASVTLSASEGLYGSFTMEQDGSWSYDADETNETVASLGVGETVQDTITVTATDEHDATGEGTVAITVARPNLPPEVQDAAGKVSEDATGVIKGVVEHSDPDDVDIVTITGGEGHYGTFTIDEQGHWTYDLDETLDAVQELRVDQTLDDVITVTATDTADVTDTANVTVTIQGANDDPVFLQNAIHIHEDADQPVSQQIMGIEIDQQDMVIAELAGEAQHGTLTLGGEGMLQFVLDSDADVQALAEGETDVQEVEARAYDSFGGVGVGKVAIAIHGVDDDPEVTDAQAETTADAEPIDGTMAIADADTSDVVKVTSSHATYGTFAIDDDGKWTYELDAENEQVAALPLGQTLTETIEVTATSSSASTQEETGTDTGELTIKIAGVNHAPSVEDATGLIAEDSRGVIRGQLEVSDTDLHETFTFTAGEGQHGTLSIDADGKWTYDLDEESEAVQAIASDKSLTDTIEVTVEDAHGEQATADVAIVIAGHNDKPVIESEAQVMDALATEPLQGMLEVSDVDTGDEVTFELIGETAYGTFVIDNTGAWSYTIDGSSEDLGAMGPDDSLNEKLEIRATDSFGGYATDTLEIVVQGKNDAPVVKDDAAQIAANAAQAVTGSMNIEDPDGDSVTLDLDSASYGELTVETDGSWSYSVDTTHEAVVALPVGATLVETLVVRASDEEELQGSGTLEITIQGHNEAPEIDDLARSIDADAGGPLAGSFAVADLDDGDSHSFEVQSQGTYGNLVVGENGAWTYTLDAKSETLTSLSSEDSVQDEVVVRVQDDHNGSHEFSLTVTVQGVNDAPSLSGDTGEAVEDEDGEVTGALTFADPDEGDVVTFEVGQASHGTLTVDEQGHWSYQLDNKDAAVQALASGETLLDEVTVTAKDDQGLSADATVAITVKGADDRPKMDVQPTFEVLEDAVLEVSKADGLTKSGASDGDGITVKLVSDVTYGTLTVNADGSFTYDADGEEIDGLAVGETLVDTFSFVLKDGDLTSDPSEASITISGIADGTISGTQTDDGGRGGTIGEDTIVGGKKKDKLWGFESDDVLDGGKGRDMLDGGDGDDRLMGDRGKDTLYGRGGDDVLDGGKGKDWLEGAAGADILTGGKGKDTFVLELGDLIDGITDFNAKRDKLVLPEDLEGLLDEVSVVEEEGVLADITFSHKLQIEVTDEIAQLVDLDVGTQTIALFDFATDSKILSTLPVEF